MKRLFLLPVLFFFALSFPAEVNAQATLKCEESGTHTIEIPNWLCYLIADYKRTDDIIKQAREDLESASLSCDASECKPNPEVFHCDASADLKSWDVDYEKEDGYFCFKGSYVVDWSCSKCRRNTIEPEPEPNPGGLFKGNEDSPISFSETTSTNQNQVIKIFPNPSEGIFTAQINIEQPNSHVHLMVTDIRGKVVSQKDYLNAPVGLLNTQQDLSDLSNGLYLLSVRIDGQVISTSKVAIQHSF